MLGSICVEIINYDDIICTCERASGLNQSGALQGRNYTALAIQEDLRTFTLMLGRRIVGTEDLLTILWTTTIG